MCAVHSDHQTVADVGGSADGTHDGGLEQGLAGDGGVAVQAGFLDHQSGSVTDVAQHLVGGGGDDQDHAGLELCADLLDGAADAGLAGGVGQSSALGADADAGSQAVVDYDEKYRNLPYIGVLKPSVYEK